VFKTVKRSWGELVSESTTADEFKAQVAIHYPRESVLQLEKIEYYCEKRFKPKIPEYKPQYTEFIVPALLQFWVDQELRANKDRPRSLFLVGESRLGKTEWARSLGKHTYFNGMFNLEDWNFDAEYLVIDDIEWKFVPAKKALMGAQKVFTMTDKYKKKVTLQWGKPCIYLCNQDMDVYNSCDERMWLRDNAEYVIVLNKLY